MLKTIHPWRKGGVVTLIPNTGVHYLDISITPQQAETVSRTFYGERSAEKDANGLIEETLHEALFDADDRPYIITSDDNRRRALSEEDIFKLRADRALDQFCGRWLPAPFFRLREDGAFANGPTNWARIFITRLDELDDSGARWRITFAFDTLTAPRPSEDRYVMPEPRDAAEAIQFGLVDRFADVNYFITTPWVRDWLRDAFLQAESKKRGGRKISLEDQTHPGVYWAHYLTILAVFSALDEADHRRAPPPILPRLRLLDDSLYLRDRKPTPVNLVIDIGNSRTCGVLIEESIDGGQRVDMSHAYRLELRDLSNPAQVYSDPFESRIEFHPANFNLGAYSRQSGRPIRDAFWWPSPVRVGPEAAWLGSLTDGTQGRSGQSSPKRYIWDDRARTTPWVNNNGLLPPGERPPPIRGPIPSRLREDGSIKLANEVPGMKAVYSRASLYTLMLTELLTHALVQINAPATRAHRPRADEARQLRRIILTAPSATPVRELRAMKKLAKQAIDILWDVMGWDETNPVRKKPELQCDWDEATATHMVYLYHEITQKLQRSPRDFFNMMRRNRQNSDGRPMLRIASMDMGGGTTDLMILQHEVVDNDRTVLPRQLFREGFRLAGDDILKQVIEDIALPELCASLKEAGVLQAENFITERFGGDRESMTQQDRSLRALFVNQVLSPVARTLLQRCETPPGPGEGDQLSLSLLETASALRPPPQGVLAYVEEAAHRHGAPDFSLANVRIDTNRTRVNAAIRTVVQTMLSDMCDVVRAYDCDVLLLSGRPSRFPVVQDLILGQMPIPPSRIIPMHLYEVGNWYPFHSPTFRIEDPKTTAAVGAMLCRLCEGQVEGLLVRASEMKIRSTARFIGFMERNDQLKAEKIVFSNINLDVKEVEKGRVGLVTPPSFLGYRQLPLERWKTTPLYYLSLKDSNRAAKLQMPLSVTLQRRASNDEDNEQGLEDFEIMQATDARGDDCTRDLQLTFQTLRVERDQEAGYWLDSGVLNMNWKA